MSKRFCDTMVWDDTWFQDLPTDLKCLWWYLFCRCDFAGAWKVNKKLAEFQIGYKINWEEATRILNGGKERISFCENEWLIKDFVNFQYGEKIFSSEHPFHKKICAELNKKRVCHTLSDTPQEKEEYKEKDINKGVVKGERENNKTIPPKPEWVETYFEELKLSKNEAEKFIDHYTATGWKVGGKSQMKDWRAAARNWKRNSFKYSNAQKGIENGIETDAKRERREQLERLSKEN